MDRAGRPALDIRRSRHGRLAVASYWVARPSAGPGKRLHHCGAGYVYRFMHFLQPTRRSFLAYGMYCRRAHGTESAHPDTTIQQVLESALYGSDVVHQGACLYRDRHQAKDGLVVESEVKRAHERYCAQSSSAPQISVCKRGEATSVGARGSPTNTSEVMIRFGCPIDRICCAKRPPPRVRTDAGQCQATQSREWGHLARAHNAAGRDQHRHIPLRPNPQRASPPAAPSRPTTVPSTRVHARAGGLRTAV